jgi:predicted secreted Zn-dependent protease
MTRILAALLAIAFAPGTDEEVVQRAHVRFSTTELVGASCRDVITGAPEPGEASIAFEFKIVGARRTAAGRYTGNLAFALSTVVITMPKSISWPHMTPIDRERADTLRRAIYHHEIGHVRVAEAVRDALNEHDQLVAPDPFALRAAADAFGREGFERFKREERSYDELTSHGRKQHLAPGELAGPDTAIVCGS